MLECIKTRLCHPKYIGLFFKDKFYKAIVIIALFYAIFAKSIFTKYLHTDQFGEEQTLIVQNIVQFSTDNTDNKPIVNIAYAI